MSIATSIRVPSLAADFQIVLPMRTPGTVARMFAEVEAKGLSFEAFIAAIEAGQSTRANVEQAMAATLGQFPQYIADARLPIYASVICYLYRCTKADASFPRRLLAKES